MIIMEGKGPVSVAHMAISTLGNPHVKTAGQGMYGMACAGTLVFPWKTGATLGESQC